jgi:TolA-binding protein|tara:strand:- start:964 stop:1179 length:216 start_codon:yes stop_codon:yes gene_type:complete
MKTLKNREEQMNNTHDNLKIMTTEEILERNVYDLQEQLNNANKRIVELQEEIDKVLEILENVRITIVNENR